MSYYWLNLAQMWKEQFIYIYIKYSSNNILILELNNKLVISINKVKLVSIVYFIEFMGSLQSYELIILFYACS